MFMKKELLSPAGNMEAAKAAIHAGADAIYIGGKSFGARYFAQNFSDEEIKDIILYAHLYDVRVYVAVNTLIEQDDIKDALEFISFLHKNNVDAVILQDIGFANLVHNIFPNLVMHASTQMNNIDSYSCKFLKEMGFKRIVLARELTIDEINGLDTDLEIEVFIHGALCICYSGCCLFSSLLNGRSGNKGMCAQNCRLPYKVKIDDKYLNEKEDYLLSPKDVKSSTYFDKIFNSNIMSYKIEGRMKSTSYIYLVTRMYRLLIDGYYDNNNVDIKDLEEKLNYVFNRGYSEGYLNNDKNIMGNHRSNHKGVNIGKVVSFNDKYIDVKLYHELRIKDGIKFTLSDKGMIVYNIYKDNEQIKVGNKGDTIRLLNNIGVTDYEDVHMTFNSKLDEEVINYPLKKMNVDVSMYLNVGHKIKIEVFYKGVKYDFYGNDVVSSINNPTSKEDVISKINKLGNTPYNINNLNLYMDDNIFVRLTDINNLRREFVEYLNKLSNNMELPYIRNNYDLSFNNNLCIFNLSVYIRNQEQLDIIKNYKINRIYTDNYDLYINNSDLNIYYDLAFNDDKDVNKVLVNSTSDIVKYSNKDMVLNYTMNIKNNYSIDYLSKYGIVNLSVELRKENLKEFNRNCLSNTEILLYGKVQVMKINHCLVNKNRDCKSCKLNNSNKKLVDAFNREYKILCRNKINYLYNFKANNNMNEIYYYKDLGIKNFRIDFLDESTLEIIKILNLYFK